MADPSRVRSAVSWLVTLFLLALVAVVIAYGVLHKTEQPPEPEPELVNVEIETVRARPYRETLTLPARLRADREAAVSPEFGGRLARWAVDEGAWVDEGGVVAELDTAILRAKQAELVAKRRTADLQIRRAAAAVDAARLALENARRQVTVRELEVRSAESSLTLAQKEFDRTQELVDKAVLDRARLDTARDALTQADVGVSRAREALASAGVSVSEAEARVRETEAAQEQATEAVAELDAALESVRVQIRKATLLAPVSGYLEEHLVEAGEVVAAGQVLARLYDLRFLRAVVDVPDRFVAFLDPSNPAVDAFVARTRPRAERTVEARVVIPGLPKLTGGTYEGLELPAEVYRVAQAADPESNTFEVELRFENPSGVLRQGVIARGKVVYLAYRDAVVIPTRSVQVTDEGPRVLVVERQGGRQVASVRSIVPASIRADEVLVLDGLSPGDRLIVAGWKGVVSGQAVNVVVEDGRFLSSGGEPERDEP